MAVFDLTQWFTVKTTKCHQMYTPGHPREGVVMIPPDLRSKLLLEVFLTMTQRGIINAPSFMRFLGDYD